MFRELLCQTSGARDYDVDTILVVSLLVCCRLEVMCG